MRRLVTLCNRPSHQLEVSVSTAPEPSQDDHRPRNDGVPGLLGFHLHQLHQSAISDDVIRGRGYQSVGRPTAGDSSPRDTLKRLQIPGWARSDDARYPGLLIPLYRPTGELAAWQYRPDVPPKDPKTGKVRKYAAQAGRPSVLDVHPFSRSQIIDPAVPLWITEGIKKGDSLRSQGQCTIALAGVFSWRSALATLGDWEDVLLRGRQVIVCFDSDIITNVQVRHAATRLGAWLKSKGARPVYIYPPEVDGEQHKGVDDFFAAGGDLGLLWDTASDSLPPAAVQAGKRPGCPYRESHGGIVWDKPTQHGTTETPVTNFAAAITREVVVDDGSGELRREFQIEGTVSGRPSSFSVPSAQFRGMGWVTEHLGANAFVYPGMGLSDHAKVAIQMLSGDVPSGHSYIHTGWQRLGDGSWVFLHAGGAIGASGPVPGIEVTLSGVLGRYALPDPPAGPALAEAVRASLLLAKVTPEAPRIMVPLLGGAYRAPLGNVTTSAMLTGPTGVRKTAVAACVQQHFGAGLDALHMASWSSTANALEDDAFLAKDVVLTVDDLAPAGLSAADAARMYAAAARLLRAQANRSGRARLRSDTTRRPERPPRGMIVATGEEAPRGHSVIARVMLLDVAGGDVDLAALTQAQAAGSAGSYAQAMAGYIRWLAVRRDGLGAAVTARVAELRAQATGSSVHGRLPETVASLMTGWEHFLAFALEVGALTAAEHSQSWTWAWWALGEAARGQADRLAAAEPAGRFIQMAVGALSAGRAHIASTGGSVPDEPKRFGWRMREFATSQGPDFTWEPRGDCIGWIDPGGVYLNMEPALAAADRLARDGGDGLQISERSLMRALHKHGYLASTGLTRGRKELKVRIEVTGYGRPYVAHLPLGAFDG
jgi:Domain of unknown function (DUF3854)